MAQTTAKGQESLENLFTGAFSTFSIKDVEAARKFYGETLGLEVFDEMEGLGLEVPGGANLFLYPKEDHGPATFTVFNFEVNDIADAVDRLRSRGLEFESYDEPMKTDGNGIFWGKKQDQGPNIAWFKDPSGNILSVIETD